MLRVVDGTLWVVFQTQGAVVIGGSPEKHECGQNIESIQGRE